MTKLFVRIYCLIMLGVLLITDIGIPPAVKNLETLRYYGNLARVNYYLLEREPVKYPPDQRQAYVDGVAAHFGYELALLPIDDIPTDAINKYRLWRGDMVADELDQTITYKPEVDRFYNTWSVIKRIENSDYALIIGWEENDIQTTQHSMQGILYLLKQRLEGVPSQQWMRTIEDVCGRFDFPVQVSPVSDGKFNRDDRQRLQAGEIVYYPTLDDTFVHYQPFADHPFVLTVGPIDHDYGALEHSFMVIFNALIFAVIVLIFLRPLWLGLKQLSQTAENFGRGELDARVNIGTYSPIVGIVNTFNNMAERIQLLVKEQKDLTNAVSHELRTPIASLRFGIEALLSDTTSDQRQHYIQRMNSDIERLDSLVEELMHFARLETREEQLAQTEIPVDGWFREQIDSICHIFPNIVFSSDIASKVKSFRCNPQLLSRAVGNLLSNAGRYANHCVQLHFSVEGERYCLCVDDDGPGIPLSNRGIVFEPFTRLGNGRDRRRGGHGLGLAIVKRIMERHNGGVAITEAAIGGCRVKLYWPIS